MDVDVSLPREAGQRVRDARKRRKLSRRRVAADAGFTRHELASVERGRRALTIDELRSLAGSIGVEATELLPDDAVIEDSPPPDEVRIEDLLTPSMEPGLESPAGPDPYSSLATAFIERRKVPIASARLMRAFADLRGRTEEITNCCALVPAADATDDVAALLVNLQRALAALEHDPAFAERLAEHQAARAEYLRSTRESSRQSWRLRTGRPAIGNQLS